MVLKRKFSILITMFVCLFALLGLTSCGGDSKDSAYDKLTNEEKLLFDYFTENQLSYFKDPTSASFISAFVMYDNKMVSFKVSGTNSYGGKTTSHYCVTIQEISDTKAILPNDLPSYVYEGIYSSIGKFVCVDLDDDTSKMTKLELSLALIYGYAEDRSQLNIPNLNEALTEYKASQGWA